MPKGADIKFVELGQLEEEVRVYEGFGVDDEMEVASALADLQSRYSGAMQGQGGSVQYYLE